ncbi:MAG: zinc ribbon domain-containing protein [Proteobacteria bacterium]|nr:zinc ribbon domain-containing protein [Pseudomonadota bacterium]
MMVIWGWRSHKCGHQTIEGVCPACHAQNLVFTRFVRVFDIFWIPVFPFEKHDHVACESCGTSYYSEHFPEAQEARREGKAPWWSFLGALIVAGIVALCMYSAHKSEAEIHAFKKIRLWGNILLSSPMILSFQNIPMFLRKLITWMERK